MRREVVIIDYGVGNLRSVARAAEHCGAVPILTDDIATIQDAERLILPGVGAFGSCMAALRSRDLVEPLLEIMHSDRPLLGICVGMQMLMEGSEEFGEHEGLGLIPGWVRSLPKTGADGTPHKIPLIAWNALTPPRPDAWDNSILASVRPGSACYFVHSFTAYPEREDSILATSNYDGQTFCAAVRHGNVQGVQFHPEKSGPIGLSIFSAFLK